MKTMRENLQDMPTSELHAYTFALLRAYERGGDVVLGGQMTRVEIIAELRAAKDELKSRQ